MAELAEAGDFCRDPPVPAMSGLAVKCQAWLRPCGRSAFECLTCGKASAGTRGAKFYRRRTAAAEILACPALLAEGSRISGAGRVKGHEEDAVAGWLLEAAGHAELSLLRMRFFPNSASAGDGLRSCVKNEGRKKRAS